MLGILCGCFVARLWCMASGFRKALSARTNEICGQGYIVVLLGKERLVE